MIIDVLSLYINLIEKLIDIVEGKKRREKVLKTPLGESIINCCFNLEVFRNYFLIFIITLPYITYKTKK
jgi:hypothetical protein